MFSQGTFVKSYAVWRRPVLRRGFPQVRFHMVRGMCRPLTRTRVFPLPGPATSLPGFLMPPLRGCNLVCTRVRVIEKVSLQSLAGRRGRSHPDEAESPGTVDVHNGVVVVNPLQDRLYGLQFNDFAAPGLIFHVRKLVIEGQLLKAMEIREAASEFQSSAEALKHCSELFDGWDRRKIVVGRRIPLGVAIGELLGTHKSEFLVAGVDFSREVMSLRSQVEDAVPGCVEQVEVGLIGLAVVRVG